MSSNPILQFIETPDYRFGYLESPSPHSALPPLVMVHGYPGRPQDFRFLFPYLTKVRCLALAMPNLDISSSKTAVSTTSIRDRERAILQFLDAMHIEQCILVGHSMGGPIVTSLTRHHPNRISGLILLSSVGIAPYKIFRQTKPRIGHQLLSLPILGPLFRPLVVKVFQWLGFPKGISIDAMCHVLHCAHDFSFLENHQNLQAIQQPVLNVWTTDDPYIESERFAEITAVVSNCTEDNTAQGGHNPQKEQPEYVARTIQQWLNTAVTQKNETQM